MFPGHRHLRFVGALAALLWSGLAVAEPFTTEAKHAVLIDVTTDSTLFAKEPDAAFPPASLAKLMTLAVAFDEIRSGRLWPEQPFLLSEHAWRTGGGPARVSSMFARLNSQVSARDLIRGVAIVVGNDAAIALAEGISGSEAKFAERMNARAQELGLRRTRFVNPTGLPADGQRTTARDLARLARHLVTAYPALYGVFAEPELDWNNIRQRNRNPLILAGVPGADGLLTGSVADFGHGLVGSVMREGKRLIVVVAGLPTEDDRLSAAKALIEWGFSGFVERELFAANAPVTEAQVFGGLAGRVPLVAREAVRLPVPRDGESKLVARVVYRGPLQAPVEKGAEVATLKVWRDGLLQREVPLVAADDVEIGTLWRRALDATLELAVGAAYAVAALL